MPSEIHMGVALFGGSVVYLLVFFDTYQKGVPSKKDARPMYSNRLGIQLRLYSGRFSYGRRRLMQSVLEPLSPALQPFNCKDTVKTNEQQAL